MNDRTVRGRILGKKVSGEVGQVIKRRRRQDVAPTVRGMSGAVVSLFDPDDFVIGHLNRAPSHYNHQRDGDNLHVSDLIGKCIRKLALSKRFGTKLPPERIYDGLGITFAQGDAIHDFVKARIAHGHPELMYGTWGCKCGRTTTPKPTTLAGSTGTCSHCEGPVNQYHEIKVVDPEYGITGSPDFLMLLDRLDVFHITEIKSINGEAFKELVRPMPDHVIQVTFYWHLMRRAGYSLTDRVSILYSNKAYSFKSPYKEFTVDVQASVSRLEPYIEDAKAYKAALGGGPLPLRSTCSTETSPEAKKCPMAAMCFAMP